MPYVPVAYPSRDKVMASAEQRWQALMAINPDLRPAVDLQRRLLTQVLELGRTIDDGRLPRLSLPARYIAAKLSSGTPALWGEPIPLPAPMLRASLVRFCQELEAGGAGAPAAHIAGAVEEGSLDAASLFAACFARNQEAVRMGASHRGLAPDLLWLVAELAVGPIGHALQRSLFDTPSGPLAEALRAWNEGYCPACGSWPALAEVVGRHRLLRCAFCAATWERTRYACVYCDESGEAFVTASPDMQRTDRRLELCNSCGAYLKAADAPEISPFPLVAVADMETMDLDVAAMEHHFGRPPLREFRTGSKLRT